MLATVAYMMAANVMAAAVPQIETDDGDPSIISISSFKQLLKDYSAYFYWIDVRSHEEIARDGTFTQALRIPIDKLEAAIPKLPADKPIILFCGTGSSAGEAYQRIKAKRKSLQVYFLDAYLRFNKQPLPQVTPID